MRKGKRILKWILGLYIIVFILLYFFQHKIIFQPITLPVDHMYRFDHPFEEVFLDTKDNARLNALHFKTKTPKGILLYFHGNRGNLDRWGKIASFFVPKGYDVVIMDYRSYGKSTGKITEDALYGDGQLFYQYVKDRYPEDKIIVYGRSLGTGIAAKIASENRPKSLILETPYFSMESLATSKIPIMPVKWMLEYKFPTNEFLQKLSCPVTIYHGTLDRVVPYVFGKELYESISYPGKQLITIEGGSHNNLVQFESYLTTIDRVLEK